MRKKIILIVLDGVGCGNAPDAAQYGDKGANTLRHVVESEHPALPNLRALGLGNIEDTGLEPVSAPLAAFGRCQEQSPGKDTTTGHWEIAGLALDMPFPTYPNGFPEATIAAIERAVGRGTLGNYAASGTAIIAELGEEHIKTGKLIVYTSADSVFQIAAHESVVPPEELWQICEKARALLDVGRVIARPFIGEPGHFARTGNRRDFSLPPHDDTLLDALSKAGLDTVGVGKIEDIFAHRGLNFTDHASGNAACVDSTLRMMERDIHGLIFTNLVDTDMLYGHRNDASGFARALEAFDAALPEIYARMGEDDLLFITADHGCDPCFPGTDHTRETVPLLVYGKRSRAVPLGLRDSFGDIASTILGAFGMPNTLCGQSFYNQIRG